MQGERLKSRYDHYTWPEMREVIARQPVCILPIGSVEDHGRHLPLDVVARRFDSCLPTYRDTSATDLGVQVQTNLSLENGEFVARQRVLLGTLLQHAHHFFVGPIYLREALIDGPKRIAKSSCAEEDLLFSI